MKLTNVFLVIPLMAFTLACKPAETTEINDKDIYIMSILSNGDPNMKCQKSVVNGKAQYECKKEWDVVIAELNKIARGYRRAGIKLEPSVERALDEEDRKISLEQIRRVK